MSIGATVKSALKETVKKLPDDFAMKSQSVAPMLVKKGVKQEELDYAKIKIPAGKVTKQQLVDAEAARVDWFKTKDVGSNYQAYSLDAAKENPTYREKVIKFGTEGQQGYTSSHFEGEQNYLMHTRSYDTKGNARVLMEIQSDLHQEAISGEVAAFRKLDKKIKSGEELTEVELKEAIDMGFDPETESLEMFIKDQALNFPPEYSAPLERSWLRKGIERELVDAVNDGKSEIRIPIQGDGIEDLHRSAGVQKWYESTVVNTMKKIAKQTGSDFVMDTPKAPTPLKLNFSQVELDKIRADYEMLASKAKAGEIDYRDPNDFVGNFIASKQAGLEELNPGVEINHFDLIDDITQGGKSVEQFTTVVDTADISYARIIPKKDFDVSLYSTPIAGAFVAYQAYQAGMSEEEVDAKLRDDYDYDDEDMEELYSRVQVINQATEAGMELDEIRERMEGREVTADIESSEPAPLVDALEKSSEPTPKSDAYDRLVDESDTMTAEELVSALKVLHPTRVSDTLTTIPAWFGNQEARQRYDKARDASREKIIGIAQEKYDLDLLWAPEGVADEGWYVQTDEGMVEVTPGFMTDFKKTYGEMTGAVIGAGVAIFAGNMGPQALFPEEAVTIPLAMAAGRIVGGGIIGAMFGSNIDYLYQAMDLQEAIEFEAMAARSLNAFEAAAVGEALGFTVAKGLGKGWKGIVEAKNYVVGGEPRRAYQSLKETTFLNDAQIEEIVAQFEKHTQLEGSRYEKGIQAVSLSEYGMQGLVEAAGKTRTLAAPTVVNTITKRADDILSQTAKLTDEQVPRLLTHDLRNYTRDVKLNYEQVKAQATQSPFGKDFEWDFEELAITPVLEELLGKNKIVDPATKEKFLNQMSRINSMTESRSFGDLLELRQMTNDFLYNKRIVKADDRASIRGVIERIDEAIEYGAPHVLDDSEKWLADWATARADYSKMKSIQKTAMYNAIFKKDGTMRAVKPEQIVKSLGNHIRSIDGSFEEVMSILPPEGRKLYEGAVVDALTQQFTTGIEEGVKAIHFPMLADALKGVSLTTPEARATKEALIFMGETFKNDVWLSQVQGKINLDTFKSYLTADPAVRAKFAAASGMFNWISSKGPGAANRQKALVRATAKLLEKPLDAKNFKFLQAEVFDDVNLSKRILGLQQAAARDRAKQLDVGTPMMNLGDGGKINGPGVQSQIPAHRVLTIQQAREIAESEALTLDSKSLDAVLKQYGYLGILEGTDRVRILGD